MDPLPTLSTEVLHQIHARLFPTIKRNWEEEGDLAPLVLAMRVDADGDIEDVVPCFLANIEDTKDPLEAVQALVKRGLGEGLPGPHGIVQFNAMAFICESWITPPLRGAEIAQSPLPSQHDERIECVTVFLHTQAGLAAASHTIDRTRNCLLEGKWNPKLGVAAAAVWAEPEAPAVVH